MAQSADTLRSIPVDPAVIAPASIARPRLDSVDLLRGTIMALMLIDHTRDFFMSPGLSPTRMATTTPALFLTRWITHFCAPTFELLAGVGAFLYLSRGKTKKQLSWFLLTRGLWLLVLEFTIGLWGVMLNIDYHVVWLLVLWALGCSMIVLAGLIHLPRWALRAVAFGLIAFHNLFDRIDATSLGAFSWPWSILHQVRVVQFGEGKFFLLGYPLIPWVAVMASGYLLGELLLKPRDERRRLIFRIGLGLTLGFIVLRAINIYGDPAPWQHQPSLIMTFCSFLNCTKQPPSLLFLMMTLGPSLMALAWFDRPLPKWTNPIITFGRVPMFFYLLQFPVAHGLALLLAAVLGHNLWHQLAPFMPTPAWYGYPLWVTYAACLVGLLLLYPLCAWYADVKKRSRSPWLSYL